MMRLWDCYPDHEELSLIEEMAWGVIQKGFKSSQVHTRLYSLISAFETQSPKGVRLVEKSLSDPNALLREAALQLASKLPDKRIQRAVMERFKKEALWPLRLQAIRTIGELKISRAKALLYPLLTCEQTPSEEKALAVKTLVEIHERADDQTLKSLIRSPRAALRLLACELAVHFELRESAHLLLPLLKDSSPEVKTGALIALGLVQPAALGSSELVEEALPLLNDRQKEVAVAAGWLLCLYDLDQARALLEKMLGDSNREARLFASGAVSSLGELGVGLAKKHLVKTADPLVKLNLAMGLICQRESLERAGEALDRALQFEEGRLSFKERGPFRYVVPSREEARAEVACFPEAIDQLVRLELLQLLSFIDYPRAQQAWRQFFKSHLFEVTAIASILFLKEGEEEALPFIRPLLEDRDFRVQTQAALVLALWSRDEEVEEKLHSLYHCSDRSVREKILEGLGKLGTRRSIPFLLERLREPFQQLRILAASSLLQALSR